MSLNSQLEAQVQLLCQPLLQGLEEGLKTRIWQLQHSNAAPTGPGRRNLHHSTHNFFLPTLHFMTLLLQKMQHGGKRC